MTKICSDCEYYRISGLCDGKPRIGYCHHETQLLDTHIVTGEKLYCQASSARSKGFWGFWKGSCGPTAKLFEEIVERKPPSDPPGDE